MTRSLSVLALGAITFISACGTNTGPWREPAFERQGVVNCVTPGGSQIQGNALYPVRCGPQALPVTN